MKLEFNKLLYQWGARQARWHSDRGNDEQAARWGMAAAALASGYGFMGLMADPELEATIRESGAKWPCSGLDRIDKGDGVRRTLHVLSEAHVTGGHTRLCYRWIELDSEDTRHSVVLTRQDFGIPQELSKRVEDSGGDLFVLNPTLPLLERAKILREYAESADCVVLHIHSDDPLPLMAFAAPGGAPVVILNHGDHLFWLGVTIADAIAEIRNSGMDLSKRCRGSSVSKILPIPIRADASRETETVESIDNRALLREIARKELGIPADAVVLLTIGTAYKYAAIDGLDFIETALAILDQLPNTHIVAVGPGGDERWTSAVKRSGNRLHAVGQKENLESFHVLADIYIEGFPFGSLTALLEAGLAGLPCVLAPEVVPLPFRSDGPALDALRNPRTMSDYVAEVARLAIDPSARKTEGSKLCDEISYYHIGDAWRKHLKNFMEEIPEKHKTHWADSAPMEANLTNYWASFLSSRSPFHPQSALKLFYQTENFGFPLDGGIDDELADGLIRLARDSKKIAPENRLSQCFVEEACRAYKAGERARILKCFFWFLRSRPSKEDYGLVGRLLSRLAIGDRAILPIKRIAGGTAGQ